MARDPGSLWRPLPEAGAPDGLTKTQFIVHSTGTMASAAANRNYFAGGNVAVESTFIVGLSPSDPTLQVMDSTDRADANGSANGRGISVEVVGDGVGPYTDWQIRELIRLGKWARKTHGILPRVIPSEAAGGFGWHVMFGAPGPWTSVRGKVCPGKRRIEQLKSTVFPAIFANSHPTEEFLMALSHDEQVEVRNTLRFIADQLGGPGWRQGKWGWPDWRLPNGSTSDDVTLTLLDYVRSIDRQVNSKANMAGRPGGGVDDELGHLLSLRAELQSLLGKVNDLVARDPS